MTATKKDDGEATEVVAPLRLRIAVVDALMLAKGIRTVEEQAAMLGFARGYWFDVRSGRRTPKLNTAMQIAAFTGTTVETLFERVAA